MATSGFTNLNSGVLLSTATDSPIKVNVVTIGESAIMYARAKTITFTVQGLKPNTQYHPFFNGVSVAAFCSIVSGQTTSVLRTNTVGSMTGNFYLPANTFLAGSHLFMLVDGVRTVAGKLVPDPIYGSAEARYEANGTLRNQQTVVTVDTTALAGMGPGAAVTTCERWRFTYVFTRGTRRMVTIPSRNPTAANLESQVGIITGLSSQQVTRWTDPLNVRFERTITTGSAAENSLMYYHVFSYGAPAPPAAWNGWTQVNNNAVEVATQDWTGRTGDPRPDLTGWRPTGLDPSWQVAVVTPWQRVEEVACTVDLGMGPRAQIPPPVSPWGWRDWSTADQGWRDPLAQSFLIDGNRYPQGAFVTSIGVYFKTVDQSTPVILELKEMSNGSPGPKLISNGRCIVPGAYASQSPDGSIPTLFTFDQPIYLKPNEEYCFVIRSPSLGYNAWCSKIGEIDIATGKVIDTTGFMGTMFMSENNSTWIPDGYQDIKFDFNVAAFDISKTSDIVIRPQKTTTGVPNYYGTAQNLPLSFISTIKDSKVVNIKIPMHNLVSGDQIHIDGIATPNPVTDYNNILAANLNGTFTATVIDEDHITITTTGNFANKTGILTARDQFNVIDNTPPVVIPGLIGIPAVPFVNSDTLSPSTTPTGTPIPTPPTPPAVSSINSFIVYTNIQVNEAMIDMLTTEMPGTTVVERLSISSGSSTAGSEVPYSYIDYVDLPRTDDYYKFQEPRMIATPLNEILHATELSNSPSTTVNIRLSSQDKNVSPMVNTNGISLAVRSYKIDNQNDELSLLTTQAQFNNPALNSEIAPGTGNALAKYKTKVRSLNDYHQTMMLFVTANCPSPAYIDAYIRTSTDRDTHIDRNWVWMPINGVFGTPFNQSVDRYTANEWMYEVTVDQPFNVYDIKLVMRSTNNSLVPKIYGLRTIADYL